MVNLCSEHRFCKFSQEKLLFFIENICATCQIDICHRYGKIMIPSKKQRRYSMKIKLIAVVLVFISSLFGTTIETQAPENIEGVSCVQSVEAQAVTMIE